MPGKGTTRRTIRIDDDVWMPAQQIAADRDENLSEIVRAALIAYIAEHAD